MAKPIGPKTSLIREAITANPGVQNKELAEMINSSDAREQDKIKVTPFEVAEQRQRMKKAGAQMPSAAAAPASNGKKRGRPKGSGARKTTRKSTSSHGSPKSITAHGFASPVDLIDSVFALADRAGGMGELKRLVDRLAPLEQA